MFLSYLRFTHKLLNFYILLDFHKLNGINIFSLKYTQTRSNIIENTNRLLTIQVKNLIIAWTW